MTFLLTALFASTSMLLEAPGVAVAALFVLGAGLVPAQRRTADDAQLNQHTLADIGIEPGAITWIRKS